MQTIQAADLQRQLSALSNMIIQQHTPVRVISQETENMVVLSEQDYLGLQETLYLLSNPHNAERLRQAREEPLEQAVQWAYLKTELSV
jgi:antitoxin YefM